MKNVFITGIDISSTKDHTGYHKVVNEETFRIKYGKLNGYYKWDLAKSWLQMSNDDFYKVFGISWVPPIWMYEQARKYL